MTFASLDTVWQSMWWWYRALICIPTRICFCSISFSYSTSRPERSLIKNIISHPAYEMHNFVYFSVTSCFKVVVTRQNFNYQKRIHVKNSKLHRKIFNYIWNTIFNVSWKLLVKTMWPFLNLHAVNNFWMQI